MATVRTQLTEQLRLGVPAWPRHPFRWAVLAILAFAFAASLLAIGAYQAAIARDLDQALLRARAGAADIDRYVQSRWWTLQAIASATEIREADVPGIQRLLGAIDAEALGLDAGISWIDPDGMMQARTGDYAGPPIDFSGREHVRESFRTGRPAISNGIMGTVNEAPIVAFVVPVRSMSGAFTGLLGSGIRLDRLSVGADSIRYAGGIDITVLDRHGQVIAGGVPVQTLAPSDPRFPFTRLVEDGSGVERLSVGADGRPDRLVGYAVSPTTGWLVMVDQPAAESYGAAGAMLAAQLLAIAVGVVLSILLVWWAARRLERAMQTQTAALAAERETRQQLQDALAVLEQRQQIRDAFVGVMSHELRTPVTTIYGAAKLLIADPDRPELRSLLEDIEAEAERLRRITEDLLVLSRTEHALLQVVPEPIRLRPVVGAAVADAVRRVPEARIEVRIDDGVPPVTADAGYVRQILDNLLGNALKYGRGTTVVVRVTRGAGDVRMAVEDGGPGLSPTEHERVFDLFYRAPENQRSASGTGIGLFVVRQLARAMGGDANVESVEPTGLRVVVTLRADPAWMAGGEDGMDGAAAVAREQRPGAGEPDPGPAGTGVPIAAGP
jgi:signal transduction histidine kinase